jgi:hypothetical protein
MQRECEAQTSVDFLVGASIFAVTLIFVLQVASVSVVNVAPESQTREAIAERAGTFVHQNFTDGNGTILEPDYEDIRDDELGVPSDSGYEINVTVRNAETGNVTNTTGPEVPLRATSGIAGERRVVDVGGNTSVVGIRVWGVREVAGGGS